MKLNSNTIMLIIAGVVVAFGIYWFSFAGGGEQPPLSVGPENAAQTQFKVLVSQLQPISFNTGIFSDPAFMSLVDLATPIAPEASGRLDPFAALSAGSGT
jgi:hypothetical protein